MKNITGFRSMRQGNMPSIREVVISSERGICVFDQRKMEEFRQTRKISEERCKLAPHKSEAT